MRDSTWVSKHRSFLRSQRRLATGACETYSAQAQGHCHTFFATTSIGHAESFRPLGVEIMISWFHVGLISDPETNPELFQDLKQKMDPQAHLKSKGSESSALISHSACNVTFFDVANSQQNLGKNMKHHAKIPQKTANLWEPSAVNPTAASRATLPGHQLQNGLANFMASTVEIRTSTKLRFFFTKKVTKHLS